MMMLPDLHGLSRRKSIVFELELEPTTTTTNSICLWLNDDDRRAEIDLLFEKWPLFE